MFLEIFGSYEKIMPVADSAKHEDWETTLGFLIALFCIIMRSFALSRSRVPKKLHLCVESILNLL